MPEEGGGGGIQGPSATQMMGWCSTWIEFLWLAKSRPAFDKSSVAVWSWDSEVVLGHFVTWIQLRAWLIVVAKILTFIYGVIFTLGAELVVLPFQIIGLILGLLLTHTAWFVVVKRDGYREKCGPRRAYLVIALLFAMEPVPSLLMLKGDVGTIGKWLLDILSNVFGTGSLGRMVWLLLIPDLFLVLACLRMFATPPPEAAKQTRMQSFRQNAAAMFAVTSAAASSNVREMSSSIASVR